MQSAQETSRIEKERPVGEREVALTNGAQVLASDVGVADGPGRQIQNSVAVVADLGEQLRHAALCPILAHNRKNVTQHIRSICSQQQQQQQQRL